MILLECKTCFLFLEGYIRYSTIKLELYMYFNCINNCGSKEECCGEKCADKAEINDMLSKLNQKKLIEITCIIILGSNIHG